MDQPQFVLVSNNPFAVNLSRWIGEPANCESLGFAAMLESLTNVVVLVDGDDDPAGALAFCRSTRARLDSECPLIVYLTSAGSAARIDAYEHGADFCPSDALSSSEFLAIVTALRRSHANRTRLLKKSREATDFNHQLQRAFATIDFHKRLVGLLHDGNANERLIQFGNVHVSVWRKKCGAITSDQVGVIQLSDGIIGFFIADLMGHDVTTGLASFVVRNYFSLSQSTLDDDRILEPAHVMRRLNNYLVGRSELDQCQLTMVYGTVNRTSGELALARAAHSSPIYVERGDKPAIWEVPGTILGLTEIVATTERRTMKPGDQLVLYSDGASNLTDSAVQYANEVADSIASTDSDSKHNLAEKIGMNLVRGRQITDDVTVLTVEYREPDVDTSPMCQKPPIFL